jgi:hypothetical protein
VVEGEVGETLAVEGIFEVLKGKRIIEDLGWTVVLVFVTLSLLIE